MLRSQSYIVLNPKEITDWDSLYPMEVVAIVPLSRPAFGSVRFRLPASFQMVVAPETFDLPRSELHLVLIPDPDPDLYCQV